MTLILKNVNTYDCLNSKELKNNYIMKYERNDFHLPLLYVIRKIIFFYLVLQSIQQNETVTIIVLNLA